MINYYHRFIPNAAGILTPLYHLSSNKREAAGRMDPDPRACIHFREGFPCAGCYVSYTKWR